MHSFEIVALCWVAAGLLTAGRALSQTYVGWRPDFSARPSPVPAILFIVAWTLLAALIAWPLLARSARNGLVTS